MLASHSTNLTHHGSISSVTCLGPQSDYCLYVAAGPMPWPPNAHIEMCPGAQLQCCQPFGLRRPHFAVLLFELRQNEVAGAWVHGDQVGQTSLITAAVL